MNYIMSMFGYLPAEDIYAKRLIEQQLEITELKKQIESLKENQNIRFNGINSKTINKDNNEISDSGISEQKLEAFIETLINDNTINIKYLPDHVEKAIYRNIFRILIGLIKSTLESTTLNIIGHNVDIKVK